MYIIAGEFRKQKVLAPKGSATRPTSARLRETVFNICQMYVQGARVLDICAGSGAVGIEALSRGAVQATFVDDSRKACAIIKQNLSALKITEGAQIINRDAIAAIKILPASGIRFNIAYLDPPYSMGIYEPIIIKISECGLLNTGGILVAEHGSKTTLADSYGKMCKYRDLKQGDSCLSFFTDTQD